jgi:hypothetical protein
MVFLSRWAGNRIQSSFSRFRMSCSRIYGDMILQEFAKNLNTFQDENLGLSDDSDEAPRPSAEAAHAGRAGDFVLY